ncbi:MAG: outer membrane beta-barrel protein [Ignavibacteriales bacterium]|nr:outer membrane beta-barrel protein [Ignavibacteriales bacterium]
MIKSLIAIFTLIFFQTIFPQINDYSIKYGIQGHLLIPNTEFKNDAYILSLFGRGFLKYEIAPSLETEFGIGIANLAGEDKVKDKWETYLIPADLRFSFSPFTSEVYSPYLYGGIGLLRWNVVKLPKDEVNKKSGWNSAIPIGAGVEFKLSSDVILDISGGYNFTSTDYLNNYNNKKSNDGYFNFGFGFTFC